METLVAYPQGKRKIKIFGRHNLTNLNAALHACRAVGVQDEQFYDAIASFKGASNRLELLAKNEKMFSIKILPTPLQSQGDYWCRKGTIS